MIITDNGLGIDLDKYGDKLFQKNSTFHNHPQVKGVGLYITKKHIESMGGSIEVTSEIGRDTTFKIILKETKG